MSSMRGDGHSTGAVCSDYRERCVVNKDRAANNNKPKPVREDAFPSELVFQKTDFSFIDMIVDPDREKRSGPKGYRPSSIFMALLLMYLQSMDSVLALVRFLNTHPQWLATLDLKKVVRGNIHSTRCLTGVPFTSLQRGSDVKRCWTYSPTWLSS